MLVPMTKVRILGRRSSADAVLGELHQLGVVELADAPSAHSLEGLRGAEMRSTRSEELAAALAQVEKLLSGIPDRPRPADAVEPLRRPLDVPALRETLGALTVRVEDSPPPGRAA